MFRFQQFTVNDDRCAMKVGTDGVLLGAWTPCQQAKTALDIGAGCGLVAMMLAQRNPMLSVTAVEIEPDAATQAAENVAESPFGNRISVECADILTYASTVEPEGFDLIVSNPPFFQETLLPPDALRAAARHTRAGLNFEALVKVAATLLRRGGVFSVIIPTVAEHDFHVLCAASGLSLHHATAVQTVVRKLPKRSLLHFQKGPSPMRVERDVLVLMTDGKRSEAYAALCRDFYL